MTAPAATTQVAAVPLPSERERAFIDVHRVGRLATASTSGAPHVVPVCFALLGDTLFVAIDAKPKRGPPAALKRLRNIAANPQAAFEVDRYAEDWSRLGWVMLRGRAEILEGGAEHGRAQAALRVRYPQYAAMPLAGLPVIALRIQRSTSWGDLSAEPPAT